MVIQDVHYASPVVCFDFYHAPGLNVIRKRDVDPPVAKHDVDFLCRSHTYPFFVSIKLSVSDGLGSVSGLL